MAYLNRIHKEINIFVVVVVVVDKNIQIWTNKKMYFFRLTSLGSKNNWILLSFGLVAQYGIYH